MRVFFSLVLLTISLLANIVRDSYILNLGTFHNIKNANKVVAHFRNDKVNMKRLSNGVILTIDNLTPFERAYEKLLRARKIVPNPYLTEAKITLNSVTTTPNFKREEIINQNNYSIIGNYMIKLGSFRNITNVNNLISKFKSDQVDIEQTGDIYRLFISNIPNLGLAQEKLIKVKRVIPNAQIVTNGYKQKKYQSVSTPTKEIIASEVNSVKNIDNSKVFYQQVNKPQIQQQYYKAENIQQVPTIQYTQQPIMQQQIAQVPFQEEQMVQYIQHPLVEQQIPLPQLSQPQQRIQYQATPTIAQQQIVRIPHKPIVQNQDIVPIITPQIEPIVQIPKRVENINVTGLNNYWGLSKLAIANSTRVELLKHDLDILLSDYDIQMSEYYPTLALTYDHQYNHSGTLTQNVNNQNEQEPQEANQNQGEFNRKHRDIANLTMNYELYRFGATDLRIKIARNRIDSLINDILVEKETISRELLAFYVEILRAQTIIHYRGLILDKQKAILKVIKELQKAGVSSEDEVKDIEIAIKTLEDEIAQSYLLKQRAVGEIETLLDNKISLQGIDFAQLRSKNLPDVEFDFTPLGQRLLIEIETSKNELELMKKDYLATINTNGNYNLYDSFADNEQTNIQSNDWRVGLNIRWEFFSGFRTDNQVKRVEKQINRNYKSYNFERRSFEAEKIKRLSLSATRHNIIEAERNLITKNKEKIKNLKVLKEANSANVADIEAAYILMLESEQNIQLQIIDQLNDDILRDLSNHNSYKE